ncbi:hypothetical protein [Adhaeribacter pallidiroseus]|uniref:Uncharacterized protein n=1 Tax=Adhaeribacter pallidiroseus TaxID=2072847 RepID=A0A369QGI5_9BACT|nr:hypothetical protein [Adhaeribacter pallidiroseus]RDC63834.1 hypothetical protein AHMF7616_02443 [Adhaeribacter pallidiroseus]
MVYSAEIRWFFKNRTETESIEHWFNAHQQFFTDKWDRADIYLWQPGLSKIGVKIREGKVEVKILLAERGVVPLMNANSGLANDWVKYSFGLLESDAENLNLLQQFSEQPLNSNEQLWVRVDKERLLIKMGINPDNSLKQVAANSWPEEGCGVELTRIRVHRQIFYTFGLEAFSKTQQEHRNLELTLQHTLPALAVNNLHHQQSNSYPGFLQDLSFRLLE